MSFLAIFLLAVLMPITGVEGHVYLREFDDGWAAVNPTRTDARGIPVFDDGTTASGFKLSPTGDGRRDQTR
jgi:hypothetical protein